jgi:hypothetical protein
VTGPGTVDEGRRCARPAASVAGPVRGIGGVDLGDDRPGVQRRRERDVDRDAEAAHAVSSGGATCSSATSTRC